MEICLEKLPAKTARIFMMREWLELDTEEICKELGVSTSNAWVMLYRARLKLRECLDLNWFGNQAGQSS
jgi:RNA polymerase sigma-70 factor (ECF subfamily)